MKSLDTNVLARFFVDDPADADAARQRPAAIQALSERAFVPLTVILELEWVLRGFYDLPRGEVVEVLRALSGVEHITLEDRSAVLSAMDLHAAGLDFADALHLVRSQKASAFVTFDGRLARRASGRDGLVEIELLE